jgi:hypothetical protein
MTRINKIYVYRRQQDNRVIMNIHQCNSCIILEIKNKLYPNYDCLII